MNVIFNPTYQSRIGCGVISAVSYSNPNFKEAMKKLFNIKENEIITDIEVTQSGITAKFERL